MKINLLKLKVFLGNRVAKRLKGLVYNIQAEGLVVARDIKDFIFLENDIFVIKTTTIGFYKSSFFNRRFVKWPFKARVSLTILNEERKEPWRRHSIKLHVFFFKKDCLSMKIKFKKIVFLQTIVFKKQSYKKTIADLFYKKRSFLKRLFFFKNETRSFFKTIGKRSKKLSLNDRLQKRLTTLLSRLILIHYLLNWKLHKNLIYA